MRYAFPSNITLDDEEKRTTGREAYNVSFPDVPEGLTCGWSWQEAIEMAEDCLTVALNIYVKRQQDLPVPSPLAEGQVLISVPPIAAASLAVYSAMRKQGITKAEMAEQLKFSEDAVGKLLDPRYRTHVSQLEKALKVVGRSLIVEDREAVYTAITPPPAGNPLSPRK
jgi:antitoxin HicB